MALSKLKKDAIISLLLDGVEGTEIAEKMAVSRKTVCRIKKELAEKDPNTAQTIVENKSNIKIRKMEEKYLDRVGKEKDLFEDPAEGWIFNMTAEELRHKQNGKWWVFIVYPESADPAWKDKLRATGCEIAISPLHDKDVWGHDSPEVVDEETGEILEKAGSRYKAGDRKKAHYHVILKTDRVISYAEVNKWIRPITNGPYLQKCMSLKGQFEYFIHLNNPEKYQYEKDEIEKYNNFVIEPTQADRMIMVDEIGRTIAEESFVDLGEVRAYYNGQYEYINVLALKAFYFEKLTQVNFRKKYPEGRTQKVRIVGKEGSADGSDI